VSILEHLHKLIESVKSKVGMSDGFFFVALAFLFSPTALETVADSDSIRQLNS
jgi:hypothetical protein